MVVNERPNETICFVRYHSNLALLLIGRIHEQQQQQQKWEIFNKFAAHTDISQLLREITFEAKISPLIEIRVTVQCCCCCCCLHAIG